MEKSDLWFKLNIFLSLSSVIDLCYGIFLKSRVIYIYLKANQYSKPDGLNHVLLWFVCCRTQKNYSTGQAKWERVLRESGSCILYLGIKTNKDKNHDGYWEHLCLNCGIRSQGHSIELNGGRFCTRCCGWPFHRHLLAIVQEHWPLQGHWSESTQLFGVLT